jgi:hypothetical protein
VHNQGLLVPAESAVVRHGPIQADQAQEALDEPSRLPKGHTEQDLHRQARLDGGIAIGLLPTTLA